MLSKLSRYMFAAMTLSCFTIALAAEIPTSVQDAVRLRVDGGKTPSMVIGLVTPGGVEYFAYGKRALPDGPTPDEHTVYEIGSITKAFTGVLLADMAAAGIVALDDPIQTHLPESVTAPTRGEREITLRDLSVQVSGLPRLPNNMTPKDALNPYADYTVEQLYECIGQATLTRDAGTEYEYSNLGVGLLGHLLERASGKTYEALIIERIAEPIGMNDTRITLTPELRERLATAHSNGRPTSNWDLPVLAGAGALRSTAGDMVRFLQANLGLIDTPLNAAMETSHEPRAEAGSEMAHIGLGWHIRTAPSGRDVVWHNGGTGGYRSFAGFTKDTQTGVVVLSNSNESVTDDLGFHMLDASMPIEDIRAREEIELSGDVLERYEGKYEVRPDVYLTIEKSVNRLSAQLTGQGRLLIFPESETVFFYKAVPAAIEFDLAPDGTVTGLTLRQSGLEIAATKVE